MYNTRLYPGEGSELQGKRKNHKDIQVEIFQHSAYILRVCYEPNTVLSFKVSMVNKIIKVPALMGFSSVGLEVGGLENGK